MAGYSPMPHEASPKHGYLASVCQYRALTCVCDLQPHWSLAICLSGNTSMADILAIYL